jgi:hypothetical protein
MCIVARKFSSFALLTRRCIMEVQSGQIAVRLPTFSVMATYSAISPAGNFGARHRKQYICPALQGRFLLARRARRKAIRSDPRIKIGRLSSIVGSPALIHSRAVFLFRGLPAHGTH